MALVIKTKAPERIEIEVTPEEAKEAIKKQNLLSGGVTSEMTRIIEEQNRFNKSLLNGSIVDTVSKYEKPIFNLESTYSQSIKDAINPPFYKHQSIAESLAFKEHERFRQAYCGLSPTEFEQVTGKLRVDKIFGASHPLIFEPPELKMMRDYDDSLLSKIREPTIEEREEKAKKDLFEDQQERIAEQMRQMRQREENYKERQIEIQVEASRRIEAEKQKANQSQKEEWLESISYEIGFYVKNDAMVDWWHWLILTEWSKEQAANLICGIDPHNDNEFYEPVKKITERCGDELKRDYAPPFVWLKWFDSVGLLDLAPKQLTVWYYEKQLEKLKEQSEFQEVVHNGESPVNWQHWANLKDITPEPAAKLANYIDPNEHKGKQFAQGDYSSDSIVNIPFKELNKRLTELEQRLRSVKPFWTLSELVEALGDDAPLGMVEAINDLKIPLAANLEQQVNQTKSQKQHAAILTAIKQLGIDDPMSVPDGKKSEIESICRGNDKPDQLLFGVDGSTSFENAWRKGKHLFRMANHASYAKRGK